MEQPRIFISHSNSDPDSPAYVEAANHALTAAGFEVLVDRIRLQPGEEWRDEIYLWMGLCHGAVVLVSPAAIKIESIWVPRETSILLWRRTLDPRFIVIPVFLGGVTAADLQRGAFADMQLTEIQAVPATTPTELANLLVARFSGLIREKSPLETLASRMAE